MFKHASVNRAYRLVWNEGARTWMAVAECARGRGKSSVRKAVGLVVQTVGTLSLLAGLSTQAQTPPAPNQLPTGGQVSAGQAAITQSGSRMDINQTSQRAVIDWQTFNIGSQAHVNFNQPGADSATLNRVHDPQPTLIFGRITAPGQVFLLNANGVYFSPQARVDVGALVASSHSLSNDAFMSGQWTLERSGATGKVINEGQIRTRLGGYVALLAPEVRNHGLILARMGTVALAAGESVTLHMAGDAQLAGISVASSTIRALVENRHIVQVDGGTVLMSAQAKNALEGSVVNTGSVVAEATGLAERGGRVVLESSGDTYLAGTGRISATSSQGQGGQVSMTGQRVALLGNSAIDASGATGGGSVRVGGEQASRLTRPAAKVMVVA
jgi:trimeric autotransporter adhesin